LALGIPRRETTYTQKMRSVSALSTVQRWLYYGFRFGLRVVLGRRRRDLLINRMGLRPTWKAYTFHAMLRPMIEWEPDVSRVLTQIEGDIFVDVGCNVGYYERLLQGNFKRIIAFEADPEIAKEAQKHAPPNTTIYHLAVSDRSGFACMHRNPQNLAGGASIVAGYNHTGMEVPSGRLSDYVPKDCVVDLVKVDVEGAEWLVLKGAEPVMPQIKRWMIELHDPTREKELDSYLRQYGYRTSWMKNDQSLPHVFATRSE
jgi:FkbM family methyltransferase